MRVAGIMSGTSLDGIDVAVCDLEQDPERPSGLTMRFLGHSRQPFPAREQVLEILRDQTVPLDVLTELNVSLGEDFAASVPAALRHLELTALDLVASHGQTIYHQAGEGRRRSTLQMGEPSIIAERCGVTVVADFRVADMAAGGQGAPLVSFFDALFFADTTRSRAIQNIGGMANVTFVPPEGIDAAYAFDTGPGNALIDYGARHYSDGAAAYDVDGAMAALGHVDDSLLEEVLSQPYFSQTPPKTTGREIFGDTYAASLLARAGEIGCSPEDVMATLTAVTAESIARAYRDFGPHTLDDVTVSGGGARNPTLMAELRQRLPGPQFHHHDEFGVPADAKEALAFALLGYEALHGRPANLPRCTGAKHPTVLGKIVPGRNYAELLGRVMKGSDRWSPSRSLRLLR